MSSSTVFTSIAKLWLAVAIVTAAVALGACGSDDDDNSSIAGNGTDLAFVTDMIPHHESAVEMARIAQERGQSEFVKQLADDIIESQNAEIQVMSKIRTNLAGVKADPLGLPAHEAGMTGDTTMLHTAKPFDRAFIDMMIPHHQGAIRMARVELEKGQSEATKQIAEDVIAAQTREINAMNEHRKAEYGAVSPAGGPPSGSEPPSGDSDAEGHM